MGYESEIFILWEMLQKKLLHTIFLSKKSSQTTRWSEKKSLMYTILWRIGDDPIENLCEFPFLNFQKMRETKCLHHFFLMIRRLIDSESSISYSFCQERSIIIEPLTHAIPR